MAETALVAVIPEVEPLVAPWRERFTTDGARGMPAHVTLLYPFADETEVDRLLTGVEEALAPFAPFEATFAATARWPDVLYLAPAQPGPFVALVEALVAAFPLYPPYAGAHDSIVPHLTVAQGGGETLASIEAAVRRALPVSVGVERVWLMANDPGGWHRRTPFTLNRH